MSSNGLVKDDTVPLFVPGVGGGPPSPVNGKKAPRTDPRLEYVVGGPLRVQSEGPLALPESIDDLTRMYGFSAYDALMAIPAVAASVKTLKLGIMSGDMQITETHPAKTYQRKSLTPEQKLSTEVRDFCDRMLTGVTGLRSSMFQMLDAVLYGCKLGEKISDVAQSGPDKGRLVLTGLRVKNRKSWAFVVDRGLNVVGILAKGTRDGINYEIFPPDKFMWFTWMPLDNDPRGTSAARPAYVPANMTVQLYREYFRYLNQFASPSVVGITAEGAENYTDPDTGDVLTPQMVMLQQLELFGNGRAISIPYGSQVLPIMPQGEGAAFINGFTFLGQECVYSILLQTRATREAEHGSKADATQGANIFDLIVGYGRDAFGDAIRNQLLKPYVIEAYGQEAADQFTPWVYFGSVAPQNLPVMWNALSNVAKAGLVTRSTEGEWRALAGAPINDPDVDAEAAKEAMQQQQEATQNAPGGASEGEDGESTDPKDESFLWAAANEKHFGMKHGTLTRIKG